MIIKKKEYIPIFNSDSNKEVYDLFCKCVSDAIGYGISEESSVRNLCEFMDGWFETHFKCNPRQQKKDEVAELLKGIKK